MKGRTTKLLLSPKGGTKWELAKDFKCKFGTVPKGFITDLASIPRFLWWILPPFGNYTKAVVWHDFCYSKADTPREQDDNDFKILLMDSKTKLWKIFVLYYGVRVFGSKYKVKK